MENRQLTLHDIAHDYINNIIQNVKGSKGIIMDRETQIIFSLETSKSLAIKEEIFMFENIEKLDENHKYNVDGIFFIRPTESNLALLKTILNNMNFKSIYLNFTNMLSEDLLKKIAHYDVNMQIQSIQEVFLDYYILNSNLFHLGIESSLNLSIIEEKMWQRYEYVIFNRIVQGIIASCLSNRLFPVIKCVKNSTIGKRIAIEVAEFFEQNIEFVKRECSRDQNGLLFIYDRREDPVTPLLNQWTYQSMLHELLGITNNIVELKHQGGKTDKFTLSDFDDKFYTQNLYSEFDVVADEIKNVVEKLNKESENIDKKVDTVEDLKKFIDKLPEKKKESTEITKHTNLFYELSEIVQSRKLLELSALEQDLACYDNKKDHFNKISNIIKDIRFSSLDKAKLYLLYCFRYEDDITVGNLKKMMEDNNLKDWIDYSDFLVSYAGKRKRTMDVLSNKDILAKSSKMFSSFMFKNQNVFFQHVSYLHSVMEKIIKGKAKESEIETVYRVTDREKMSKAIVFTYGGATYEESRDLHNLSKALDIPIILGGTYIHNSKTFIAELAMLKFKNDSVLSLD